MQFILPSILTRKFKNRKRTSNIAFKCAGCDVEIIKNSREHDECWTKNDKDWFCGDCACDEDGMEDCEHCGYTHWYEDKCPSEEYALKYDCRKWRVDEDVCYCEECDKEIPEDERNIVEGNYYCDNCLTPEMVERM